MSCQSQWSAVSMSYWPLISISHWPTTFSDLVATHSLCLFAAYLYPPPTLKFGVSLGSPRVISSIFMVSDAIYMLRELRFLFFPPWALDSSNAIPPLGCLIDISNVMWTKQNYEFLFLSFTLPSTFPKSSSSQVKWHHCLLVVQAKTPGVILHFFLLISY